MNIKIAICSILLLGLVLSTTLNKVEHDNIALAVFFCPKDDCETIWVNELKHAKHIRCALHDLDNEKMIDTLNSAILQKKEVKIVIDENYKKELENTFFSYRYDDNQQITHNKFCILDEQEIITGSTNPTEYGLKRNNNALIIINSTVLAKNYESEFNELWKRKFGKGGKTKRRTIESENLTIENYFCPDDCKKSVVNWNPQGGKYRIIELIEQAEKSVKIAAFSLTQKEITDAIITAKKRKIEVEIIIEEKRKNGLGSQYKRLKEKKIDIKGDTNHGTMHHKFIIIDERIVVVGSMNFSNNGNDRNDENIIIIHNKRIAEVFTKEFKTLSS